MERAFAEIGRQVVRFRWAVLALWLGLLLFAGMSARGLPDVLKGGGFEVPGSESVRAAELLRSEFPGQPAHTLLLVFRSEGLKVDQGEYRAAVEALTGGLAAQPGIGRILTTYDTGSRRLVSSDGQVTFAVLALETSDADEARDLVPRVRQVVAGAGLPDWLTAKVTGGPAVSYDTSQTAAQDLPQAERVGLPITLLTLIVVFGALVAAGLPLLVGISAIAVTMGAAYFLGQGVELSSFIQNVVPMLGLGVGIDYCLFMVSRFREELAAGLSKEEAVVRTMATAGRAVAFSGGTVAIGLSALLVPNLMMLRSVGVGGILVVAVAVMAALTLLPALLALLGDRVNAPSFLSRRLGPATAGGFWRRWALAVMRRPLLFSLVAIAALALLAIPTFRMNTLAPGATLLPQGVESREAFEALTSGFNPGEMAPISVLVDTGLSKGLWDDESLGALYDFVQSLQKDSRVARVESLVSLDSNATLENYRQLYDGGFDAKSHPQTAPAVLPLIGREGRATLVRALPSVDPDSLEARELVKAIRGEMVHAVDWPAGAMVLVGGTTASSLDMEQELYGRFPLIVGLVLGVTFIVLALLLRSLMLPLQAILMNGLSVLASYGLLVLVFQDGYGADWLGFTPPGAISSMIPVALFCILFGLSMDYEVFLLSRMREGYEETGNNDRAVAWGLERTGRVITSAALVMVTIFGSFALSSFVLMKELGLGMSAAVLLDATLIRVLLVPASMRLLGRWNWRTPSFLRSRVVESRRA